MFVILPLKELLKKLLLHIPSLMKKIFIVVSLLAVVALMSACKTHERCAAYGKYGSLQVSTNNNKA
jgi:hypothetical protein